MDRITVTDIAKELNISQGTVSKALSGKKGVSKEMRERVAGAAQRGGYVVNNLAQGLARKPINIGVVMPNVWKEFYGYFGYLKCGIEAELASLENQKFHGKFSYISGMYAKDEYRNVLTAFAQEKDSLDAVILCPALAHDYAECLDALYDEGIKTVILGNTIVEGKRFAEVRMASEIAGSLAAEYTSLLCGPDKSAVVFIGNKDMDDHRRKAEYFQLVADQSNLRINGIFETQDDMDVAYTLTRKVVSQPGLGAIYVATGNSVAVCRCLQDMQMTDRVKVVATDIFPDMHPYVEAGIIPATIYQDPVRMGRMAVRTLFDAVSTGVLPENEILIYPQLVLKSNYHVIADELKKIDERVAHGE